MTESASVLSFQQSLGLYRENARKSNDPQVLLDFAKYLLETSSHMGQGGVVGSEQLPEEIEKTRDALQAEAIRIIKRMATQNIGIGKPSISEAQFFLAECYGRGLHKLKVDHDKSFSLYVQASKQNHPTASYRVGVCYEMGAGTKKDANRSVGFYRKAAALGEPLAMHKLGLILLNGWMNQQKNPREGVTWLKRAAATADSHHPQALHDLAMCHEKGGSTAVIPDECYAKDLYTQAAELGYAPSQYKLGCCYEYGLLETAINPSVSIEWYKKAADQGYPEAELALSGWYLTGAEGILKQSDTDAYIWARNAADKKFPKAEYAVGHYSEKGIGVRPDIEESKRWYARAAAQGNQRAVNRLKELKVMNQGKKESDCVIS